MNVSESPSLGPFGFVAPAEVACDWANPVLEPEMKASDLLATFMTLALGVGCAA